MSIIYWSNDILMACLPVFRCHFSRKWGTLCKLVWVQVCFLRELGDAIFIKKMGNSEMGRKGIGA